MRRRLTAADVADVTTESLTESYYNDLDDISLAAAEDDDSPAGGRIARDDRFCEGTLLFDGDATSGTIVVDFASGCTDPRGNVRTGKLILTYLDGPIGQTGFTVQITPENYTINGVKLEGTRTIERLASANQNSIKHQITLVNGKATWPDQSISTRSSSFVREINIADQTVKLDGSAEGTNRSQKSYTVNILETLLFKRSCVLSDGIYMPVDGRKKFTSDGREMIVDYGDGACDRQITVQIGDFSRTMGIDG